MALTKSFLKITHQDCVAKVAGTGGPVTINLTTDLLPLSGQVVDGDTQTVNITGVSWTGSNDAEITITRNSVVVMTLPSTGSNYLDFDNSQMTPEITGNTYPLVVTVTGTQAEVWIRLKKVSGYRSTIEYSTYGAYDDSTIINE